MSRRYVITTADGRTFSGMVHGSGGIVGDGPRCLDRLRTDARRAAEGKRLSIYEPKPGHARVYQNYTAEGSGNEVDVPLAGATVEVAS